jgi:hypothetical protein
MSILSAARGRILSVSGSVFKSQGRRVTEPSQIGPLAAFWLAPGAASGGKRARGSAIPLRMCSPAVLSYKGPWQLASA